MPAINGRHAASITTPNSKSKKDANDPFMKKYNQKGGKYDEAGAKGLDLKNHARHRTNQGRKNSPMAGDLTSV